MAAHCLFDYVRSFVVGKFFFCRSYCLIWLILESVPEQNLFVRFYTVKNGILATKINSVHPVHREISTSRKKMQYSFTQAEKQQPLSGVISNIAWNLETRGAQQVNRIARLKNAACITLPTQSSGKKSNS